MAVAASVTIKDAPRMTAAGRRRIAAWMRRTARDLETLGKDYAPRFVARYRYAEKRRGMEQR